MPLLSDGPPFCLQGLRAAFESFRERCQFPYRAIASLLAAARGKIFSLAQGFRRGQRIAGDPKRPGAAVDET
ncbi:MAG: hypothetical protein AMXMBFR33_57570 [Candidatus Xenobia bacterium]